MRREQHEQLKSNIRCCISCILPCGALDVIRIVHSNGRVQEIACTIRAADVLDANPKHVLKTPTSSGAVVVPPDAYLQRGKIYFLIPSSAGPTPAPKSNNNKFASTRCSSSCSTLDTDATSSSARSTVRTRQNTKSGSGGNRSGSGRGNPVISTDQYLTELLSEKVVSVSRERRRGRVGVWRPHLESICETLS